MSESSRPLLLLDVDGPLNPFAAGSEWLQDSGYALYKIRVRQESPRTFSVRLNPAHGPRLLALAEETGAELVWATTWEHYANEHIGPRIGLPELPVIEFARKFDDTLRDDHWKFDAVLKYAGDRPIFWLDDDFDRFDEDEVWFLNERGDIPTYLCPVDPALGLTLREFSAFQAWATGLCAHERAASQEN